MNLIRIFYQKYYIKNIAKKGDFSCFILRLFSSLFQILQPSSRNSLRYYYRSFTLWQKGAADKKSVTKTKGVGVSNHQRFSFVESVTHQQPTNFQPRHKLSLPLFSVASFRIFKTLPFPNISFAVLNVLRGGIRCCLQVP